MKKTIFILVIATLMGVLASCDKNDDLLVPEQAEVQAEKSESRLKSTRPYLSFNRTRTVDYALDHTVYGINQYGNFTGD